MAGCQGRCSPGPTGGRHFYGRGGKWCKPCGAPWLGVAGRLCPCCGSRLRTRPREPAHKWAFLKSRFSGQEGGGDTDG